MTPSKNDAKLFYGTGELVAEDVETTEQLAMLQTLSCDEVQGYFIARPMPARGTVPLLGRRTPSAGLQAERRVYADTTLALSHAD